MTDQAGPIPLRIGDAERDRAAEYLRDHLAEGRLDQVEFDERLTVALTAKTQADLDPLFSDLPSPKPGAPVAPPAGVQAPPWQQSPPWGSAAGGIVVRRPVPPRGAAAIAVLSAMALPAAIILVMATGGHLWWIMFLPFFLPWWLGQGHRRGPRRR